MKHAILLNLDLPLLTPRLRLDLRLKEFYEITIDLVALRSDVVTKRSTRGLICTAYRADA